MSDGLLGLFRQSWNQNPGPRCLLLSAAGGLLDPMFGSVAVFLYSLVLSLVGCLPPNSQINDTQSIINISILVF